MIKNIHSSVFDVTDALRDHVNQNLTKIEGHHDRITRVDVNLKKDKFKYVAEFTLSVPQTKGVVVNATSDDMYHSITEATNKVLLKLKKLKEKQKGKLHERIAVEE